MAPNAAALSPLCLQHTRKRRIVLVSSGLPVEAAAASAQVSEVARKRGSTPAVFVAPRRHPETPPVLEPPSRRSRSRSHSRNQNEARVVPADPPLDIAVAIQSAPVVAVLGCLPPSETGYAFEVREASSQSEKEAAVYLHLSKNTFLEEHQSVRIRVHEGETLRCRTWILVATSPETNAMSGRGAGSCGSHSTLKVAVLAAVTLRANPYSSAKTAESHMWVQILNMSVARERSGLGTALVAGLEELLRREGADVVVLYPAENGRAPAFWASLGYGTRGHSFLPEKELRSQDEGGSLMPEYDVGVGKPLPRWEKRLTSAQQLRKFSPRGTERGALGNRRRVRYRAVQACESRISGDELSAMIRALQEQRTNLKEQAQLQLLRTASF